MTTPYLSELRIFSFNFAPKGWALCNGQLLPINQNQALFSLLGTTYGGDGRVTFGLPNLQGRVPIHMGGGFTLGQQAGEQQHTLIVNEMPAHNHPMNAKAAQATLGPTGRDPSPSVTPAQAAAAEGANPAVNVNIYGTGTPSLNFAQQGIGISGGSQPHNNMQPFLVLTVCIALQGIYPSQS
jgi:microcystin-dependent protein